MLRRLSVRIAIGFALLFAGSALYCGCSYYRGAKAYAGPAVSAIELSARLRSWPEHDALYPPGTDGYLLEIDNVSGALLYYGSKHTRDPNHPQRTDIERKWREFRPTVALCEGRARGYMTSTLLEVFNGLTEPMLVHRLAHQDGIPIYSLEPAYEDEVAALLKQWPAELVALYFTMRVYWSESQGVANDPLAAELLALRSDVRGLRGAVASVERLDQVWRDYLPDSPTWRTMKSEPEHSVFEEISFASRTIRGEHMVRALVDLVRKGERVFAVVGCSHVIRQELMLRAMLGE